MKKDVKIDYSKCTLEVTNIPDRKKTALLLNEINSNTHYVIAYFVSDKAKNDFLEFFKARGMLYEEDNKQ